MAQDPYNLLLQWAANSPTQDQLSSLDTLDGTELFLVFKPGEKRPYVIQKNKVFVAGEAITSILGLTDTPDSFLGQKGKILVVKQDETGLEYKVLAEVTGVTEQQLNDAVANLQGQINAIETGGSSNLTELISFASGWEQGTLNYQPVADWKKDGVLDSFTGARTLVPDPSLPMYALWYIDLLTETVEIKYGQPSANPEKPTVDDPVNHLDTGAFVHLAAGATVPTDVSGETIYAEGGEWAVSGTGTINTASTDTPHGGTNNLHAVLTTGQYIQFTAPSARETAGKELAYWIDNITGGSHSIVFIGTLAKNAKTGSVTVASPGVYNPSITTWQAQSLPLPSELTNITSFRIVAGANIEIKLDDMRLISGGGVVIVEGVTKEFVLAEDAKRLDLRASNLASDLSEAEKTVIKNKLGVVEGGGATVPAPYATMAALYADQANQVTNQSYRVDDASAHPDVTSGRAWFDYKGTTVGDHTDYILKSEEESLNLDAQLTSLQNQITSNTNSISGHETRLTALEGVTAPIPRAANFIVAASDHKKDNYCSAALIVTVPTNASVPIAVGFESHYWQTGTGAVTFAGASGVTVNKDASELAEIAAQYNAVTLKKIATDSWILIGALKKAA